MDVAQQSADTSQRRLYVLYCATTLLSMSYGLLVPFLPILAQTKSVSEWDVGLIFSAFPFMGMIGASIAGSFLYKLGRRNTLSACFLLTAVGFLASAVSTSMPETHFVVANLISRGLCGFAFNVYFTATIAVITSDFPDNVFEYVGINESCLGLGFLLGPLSGSGLYLATGFEGTFYTAAGSYAVVGVFFFCILGRDRPYRTVQEHGNLFSLACKPRVAATLAPLCFGMTAFSAQYVFASTHLRDNGLSTAWVAAAFGITGAGYLLTCVVLAKTIERLNKRAVNIVAAFLCALSMVLVGPWPSLLPESLSIILVGFSLMPLGLGTLFVEIIPSLLDVTTQDLGLKADDKLVDKLAGVEQVIVSLGEFAGPLLQGALIPAVGLKPTCALFGAAGLVVIVIYPLVLLVTKRRQPSLLDS